MEEYDSEPPAEEIDLPPQDLESERAVLGAMLLDNGCIGDVMEELTPSDFYAPSHQMIYEAALELYDLSQPVDILTLRNRLEGKDQLKQIGGMDQLVLYASGAIGSSVAVHHAKIVRNASVLRQVRAIAVRAHAEAKNGAPSAPLVDWLGSEVLDLAEVRQKRGFVRVGEIVTQCAEDVIEQCGSHSLLGVSTGFRQIDNAMRGFQTGQLIIFGARPSVGKSALACEMALRAASNGVPTAIFSLEMTKQEIVNRYIAQHYGFGADTIRMRQTLGKAGEAAVRRVAHELREIPLYIDDDGGVSMQQIRARTRRLHRKVKLGLVIVDYLQLMQSDSKLPRHEQVAQTGRGLKLLARELELPLLALSQLNRASVARADKKPDLADLRESGALEQDADAVALLHRPWIHDKEQPRELALFILAKQRNGPTGEIPLKWDYDKVSFEDAPPDFCGTDGF